MKNTNDNLPCPRSDNRAENLIAQTHEIVVTAHDTLRALLASDDGNPIEPPEYS